MPRLIETKEPRPEYSTVINWTVPVYIKNGEDYYKVCFDIKRKPLSDGTLELTDEELKEFKATRGITNPNWIGVITNGFYVFNKYATGEKLIIADLKTLKWLAERFDLTEVTE